MVGQQLQRDAGEQGSEQLDGLRNLDAEVRHPLDQCVALGDNGDDFALAGNDLLNVAHRLFVSILFCGQYHHGHLFVDEGDGAVFHLCRWIAFCVDVGDLFELQCAFEGHGVVDAAPEVDGVPFFHEELRYFLNLVVQFEGLLHLFGNQLEAADDAVVFGERQGAFLAGETEGHQGEHGDLCGESLGRCNADFRTRVGIGAGLRDA